MALQTRDAAARDDRAGADRDRMRTERERLDGIDAILDAAHQHDRHFATRADLIERVHRLLNRGQRWDTDELKHLVAGGAGRALHAVELDEVEAILVGDLDVVAHAAGAELDRNRQAIAGRFPELLDLDHEVVRAEHVRMTRRRAQIDAFRNTANARDLLGHLLGHELAAETGFRTLRDIDLEPVGALHVVNVPAEPAGKALIDDLLGGVALLVAHAAFAGVLRDVGER